MNLQEINPPLRFGQIVACSSCGRMTRSAKADLDAPPFTFYCPRCARFKEEEKQYESRQSTG